MTNDKKITELIKKIDQNFEDVDAYLELSTILIEKQDPNDAIELLLKAKTLVKNSEALDFNLAIAYYYVGDFKHAEDILSKLPNTDENNFEKARVYFKLGKYAKSLAFILTVKSHDDRYFELLGDIWLALGDNEQAYAAFNQIKTPTAKSMFLAGVSVISSDFNHAQEMFAQAKKMDQKVYQQLKTQFDDLIKVQMGKNND